MRGKKTDTNSPASNLLFEIDERTEKRLSSFANVGLGFKSSVERLHVAPRTLIRAAARQKKLDWLCNLFPASAKTIRREINADLTQALQTRALARPWRASEMNEPPTTA